MVREQPEPVMRQEDERLDYLERWKRWAEERMTWLTAELIDANAKLIDQNNSRVSAETALQESLEKMRAYEKVLSSRKSVAAFEPGRPVKVGPNREFNGTVILVQLTALGVSYSVGFWRGAEYVRVVLPSTEVQDVETPLTHPSQLWGKS